MDLGLKDRVALVTGGASGIGRACVEALVEEGVAVGIVDRSEDGERIAQAHRRAGASVVFARADVTKEDQVERAIGEIVGAFGQLDIVLACAGVSGPVGTRLAEITVEAWDRVFAVNVRGNFLIAKHAIALLERSDIGSIVFLASDSAFVAFDGMGPYTASKGAVVALTKAFAVDYPKIRVNALCPGVVDTPMSRMDMGLPDGFSGSSFPVLSPRDVAHQALFLVTPVNSSVNATALVADFGYLARSALGALNFGEPQ